MLISFHFVSEWTLKTKSLFQATSKKLFQPTLVLNTWHTWRWPSDAKDPKFLAKSQFRSLFLLNRATMNGRRGGRQTAAYLHPDFFPAKIFTVPCVNLFSVSDIYFQTRIADKDLLFLRRLLGTRQAYKWGVVHLTEVQPVKGAEALDLEATCRHIWANFGDTFRAIFCNMSELSNDTIGPTSCHLATFPSLV